ncbi:cell division protein FtsQ/DivIB [Streptomyces avicenniae]|uniref:cell division protein FtsQ/DivIB n=1 Tax=Streptomyces avicenniae TaxID=500153 RepID=UPI00069B4A9A|nr:FtsQ-type POTRA domain-containing protein [Streptomyces avicenniae]
MAGTTTARRGGRPRPGPPPPAGRLARLLRPRGRRVLVLALVLAAALGGFGTWALYGSDWLRVEDVAIERGEGPEELTERQILEAAAVPLGSPLASLDTGTIRDRLLSRLPRLKSADVERSWPDGVSLSVTEREAELLQVTGDGFTEVDGEGVAFAEIPEALPGVPLLELDLSDSPSIRRFDEERVRGAAVSVVRNLPGEVREELRLVRATSYDAITLELSGERTVRWGSAEQPAEKASALAAVLEAAPDAAHFDVSAPSVPASAEG